MTVIEVYLVVPGAIVTFNYIPVMTPGLYDTFPDTPDTSPGHIGPFPFPHPAEFGPYAMLCKTLHSSKVSYFIVKILRINKHVPF